MNLGKVVSLLEILRLYAQAYPRGAHALALLSKFISDAKEKNQDVRGNVVLLDRLRAHLVELRPHCEHLPMTELAIGKLLRILETTDAMRIWNQTEQIRLTSIAEIQSRLEDELSLNLFFKLPIDKKPYFDKPFEGWEEIIARFPETASNVEEMSKCFALSRYAASVFHSVRAIESGLIHLGKFLGVKDPLSGWTAVTSKLEVLIVKTNYSDLPPEYKSCFPFLEQMQGVAQALKSAWRNKISHAQGSLGLMTEDFSPDVAQEIVISSRSFMRRLATELPSKAAP